MMVDDISFNDFVNNNLPQAKMMEVENALMENGEADAAIHASRLNYSVNADYAEELLGIDEKISGLKDRSLSGNDSMMTNDQSLTLSKETMNNNLSKEEALKVKDLAAKFNESFNAELSLEENLVNFYLAQRPGEFPETAHEAVAALRSGIESFNERLKKAIESENFDYSAELANISSELSVKEKYEMYVNFLAALQTLSVSNLSPDQLSQLDDYNTVRGRLVVKEEVTEEMLREVEAKIGEMLENNTFCLGSIEKLKGLMAELPNGSEAIESVVTGSENDMREKMVASMATYIAYLNGDLESLKDKEISPEAIAISAAAGVEEMHVLDDLNNGRTTVDKAIEILKLIGGVALMSLLVYVAVKLITGVGMTSLLFFMLSFGSTNIATIGAIIATSFVVWALADKAVGVSGDIVKWSSKIFDFVVETWRKTVWPRVHAALSSVAAWFESLSQKGTAAEAEQGTDSVQNVSAV